MISNYRPSNKYPKNWNRLRFYIFKRDHFRCQRCGIQCDGITPDRKPVCHHKIPIECGGTHHPINLITVCNRCHKIIHGYI